MLHINTPSYTSKKDSDNFIQIYSKRSYVIISFLFVTLFLFHSALPARWDYDRFAAIGSHLELSDLAFIEKYKTFLPNYCQNSEYCQDVFLNILLPIFIVPIRWTYALGISPIWTVSRVINLDWIYLKTLLLLPSMLLSVWGICLILRCLQRLGISASAAILFLALMLWSSSFLYWTISFSSYALHILAFSLFLYTHSNIDSTSEHLIFGKSSLARAIIPILNYQYIPILFIDGLLSLLMKRKHIAWSNIWPSWLLCGLVSMISIAFLILRGLLTGKHTAPTTSFIAESQFALYNFRDNVDGFWGTLNYLASRYFDIFQSLFVLDYDNISRLGLLSTVFFWLFAGLFFFCFIKFSPKPLSRTVCIFYFVLVVFHLSGLMLLSPTRHQLILFIPTCLILAILVERAFISVFLFRYSFLRYFGIFVLLISYLSQVYLSYSHSLNYTYFNVVSTVRVLHNYRVQRVVFPRCDIEPILHNVIRHSFSPVYRCGSFVATHLSSDIGTVAILSSRPLDIISASDVVADFSDSEWSFEFFGADAAKENGRFVVIAKR